MPEPNQNRTKQKTHKNKTTFLCVSTEPTFQSLPHRRHTARGTGAQLLGPHTALPAMLLRGTLQLFRHGVPEGGQVGSGGSVPGLSTCGCVLNN